MSIYILLLGPETKPPFFPPLSQQHHLSSYVLDSAPWPVALPHQATASQAMSQQGPVPAEPGDDSRSTRQAGYGTTRVASMGPVAPVLTRTPPQWQHHQMVLHSPSGCVCHPTFPQFSPTFCHIQGDLASPNVLF